MKRLIFRLSSLGDVILSQALLETPYEGETHWVVAKEYESLLVGNPKIARIWCYDRKVHTGLRHWLAFLGEIQKQGFDEIVDVHSTLRTKIAKIYFSIHSLLQARRPEWKTISKERYRRMAYILLKCWLPKNMRPRHFSRRAGLLVGGSGSEKPNLMWLLPEFSKQKNLSNAKTRIAIVPSSAWRGKEWPTVNYLELIAELRILHPTIEIALLGIPSDVATDRLVRQLESASVSFINWTGQRPLREVAQLIATCDLSIGADTGLLHLSEAVGVPVVTVFGPTRSDFGFGPLHSHSVPVDSTLWCSPCSKDGSLCFRLTNKYRCLDETKCSDVLHAVQAVLARVSDTAEVSQA